MKTIEQFKINLSGNLIDIFADYVSGGELFTHLYQREKFKESEVRIYTAEIILALQHLHKVNKYECLDGWLRSKLTWLMFQEGPLL